MKAGLEALTFEMERNPGIFVLGEGIGKRGGNFKTTEGLYDRFGAERLCDTPIAERGFVGLAGGAAMTGTRPVVDFMFADFVLDAVGEIVNQIAKIQFMSSGRIRMPVLLRGCIGIGHCAATITPAAITPCMVTFRVSESSCPQLRSTPRDSCTMHCVAMTRCCSWKHRELLTTRCHVPETDYEIPFGQARVARTGTDITVVALARMVHLSLEAAATLQAEGISVEIIDPRTVSPLDTETILNSVSKTGRLLIVDETFAPFGVGAEIAATIADEGFDELDAPFAGSTERSLRPLTVLHSNQLSFPTKIRSSLLSVSCWRSNSRKDENMPIEVTVPRLGWSMDEGTFAEWLIPEGGHVRKGDLLFVLEGDKAAQEIESFDEGTLKLLPASPRAGEKVKVGQVLAVLLAPGETYTAGPAVSSNSPVAAISEDPPAGPHHDDEPVSWEST